MSSANVTPKTLASENQAACFRSISVLLQSVAFFLFNFQELNMIL